MRILSLLYFFLWLPFKSFAQEEATSEKENSVKKDPNTVEVCGVAWPPFTYAENKMIVKGVSHDIHQAVFTKLGMKLVAHELPWPRCLSIVEEGKMDAVIDNAPLEPYIYGENANAFYPLAIYVRADFPIEQFSWFLMRGKRVGMVRGYDYTEKIQKFKGWKKDLHKTDAELFEKLKKGWLDYILVDIFSAPLLAEQTEVEIKSLHPMVDTVNLYLDFSPKNKVLAEKYDRELGNMIKSGEVDKIYKKYMPYTYRQLLLFSTSKAE
ncbi:substrate-binding periplasmic protein [Algicola sagamiensis]|uniref:substrate-binding periplasmic protein n=1 Tax=Algicola sagamiensis TaxID=163869 RepID=UPI000376C200|nr:transporter substrate-binding domain-containing protein [Algicola sagamiensis]